MLTGIDHHLVADRWFHAAPVFLDGEQDALAAIRAAEVDAPRIGLFAHILWELCLDGELVRRVGLEAMLGALREGFDRVKGSAADAAVDLHHFGRRARSPEERAAFDARMERIFSALAAGPWIDGYQRGDGIAARIEGVRVGIGLGPLEGEARDRLGAAADALLALAGPAIDEILAERFSVPPR